jgi:hypothetical protein
MSFITCIIGGSVPGHAVQEVGRAELRPLARLPPFSQTTTLSNLMFEMALAEARPGCRGVRA